MSASERSDEEASRKHARLPCRETDCLWSLRNRAPSADSIVKLPLHPTHHHAHHEQDQNRHAASHRRKSPPRTALMLLLRELCLRIHHAGTVPSRTSLRPLVELCRRLQAQDLQIEPHTVEAESRTWVRSTNS